MGAATLESKDVYDAIEMYFEKGWTDGLPIVPPIEEFVAEFLTGLIHSPQNLWHDALIVLDEAQRFAPQTGQSPWQSGRQSGFIGNVRKNCSRITSPS